MSYRYSNVIQLLLVFGPQLISSGFGCLRGPCLNGICIDGLNSTSHQCYCIDGFTGYSCEINWNECNVQPCRNGGKCTDGIATFNCSCPGNFVGTLCEYELDDCDTFKKCENNASCKFDPNLVTQGKNGSGFYCSCPYGYTGDLCEKIVVCNETETRCRHGDCVQGQCRCDPGYVGTYCDEDYNECSSSPCQNGGICIDGVNSFKCACPFSYTGPLCESRLEICTVNVCQNGGFCLEENGHPTCYCVPDYHGKYCQDRYDECQQPPFPKCHNGGTCIDGVGGYNCSCPPNFYGDKCQCYDGSTDPECLPGTTPSPNETITETLPPFWTSTITLVYPTPTPTPPDPDETYVEPTVEPTPTPVDQTGSIPVSETESIQPTPTASLESSVDFESSIVPSDDLSATVDLTPTVSMSWSETWTEVVEDTATWSLSPTPSMSDEMFPTPSYSDDMVSSTVSSVDWSETISFTPSVSIHPEPSPSPTMVTGWDDVTRPMDMTTETTEETETSTRPPTPTLSGDPSTTEMSPSASMEHVTTEMSPTVATEKVTTEMSPSVSTENVTTEMSPSVPTENVTTEMSPTVSTETATTEMSPSVSRENVTTEMSPSVSTENVTTEVSPRVSTESITRPEATDVTTPSIEPTQDITAETTNGTRNVVTDWTTTQMSPEVTTPFDLTTYMSTESTTQATSTSIETSSSTQTTEQTTLNDTSSSDLVSPTLPMSTSTSESTTTADISTVSTTLEPVTTEKHETTTSSDVSPNPDTEPMWATTQPPVVVTEPPASTTGLADPTSVTTTLISTTPRDTVVSSTPSDTAVSTSTADPCHNYCQHSGTCLLTPTGGPVCLCKFKFTGTQCELNDTKVRVPALRGNSYLQYNLPRRARSFVNVSLKLATVVPDGLVLYTGSSSPQPYQSTYFAFVFIKNGHVVLQFSCGQQSMEFVETRTRVNTGYNFTIELILRTKNGNLSDIHCFGELRLNGSAFVMSGEQLLANASQEARFDSLYIGGRGGLGDNVAPVSGLRGCLATVTVNNLEMDLYDDAVDGQEITECDTFACVTNPCFGQSQCVPSSSSPYWECICPLGYDGPRCQIPACSKPHPCQNGATCTYAATLNASLTANVTCLCTLGFTGKTCAVQLNVTKPSFRPAHQYSSYISYSDLPPLEDWFQMKFHFVTANLSQIALLLYIGNPLLTLTPSNNPLYLNNLLLATPSSNPLSLDTNVPDFFALSFLQGLIGLTWNLGSGSRRIVTRSKIDSRLQLHTVYFGRSGPHAWIKVDGMRNISGKSPGTLYRLDVDDEVYVGGHDLWGFEDLPHDFPKHVGFTGCIFDLGVRVQQKLFLPPTLRGRNVKNCFEVDC